MRRALLPGLLAFLAAPALALDVLPLPNGDFAKAPGKAPAGWELQGKARAHKAAAPHDQAWVLERSARLALRVPLPPVREAKGVAADGWYAVVSLDVLGVLDGGRAQLELVRKSESGHKALNKVSSSVNFSPGESAPRRLWLRLSPEELSSVQDLSLELRVKGGGSLVVDDLRVERFHQAPKRSLRGKENGKNGPDVLGAGMLGFTGLVVHQGTSFSILDVRKGGPAARAGLVPGDLVVSVEGVPLPTSSLAPGWAWFERSNEAVVGRAIEAALAAGRSVVQLGVLRGDEVEELDLKLPLKDVDLAGFPLRGPLAERLRGDLLAWTLSHQKGEGGWPGSDAVNPALGGLALLGTRDRAHAPAVRRCFEFLLAKNPHPSAMKGLAYWTIAFQGMFFAEYYLASGDERAKDWMAEAAEWLPSTTHESKWGMQAFGHGPDGLPYDNKALMAPTAHLLVFDALARRCGVESRIFEHVKEYVVHSWSDPESGGHGGMGYNASYKDKGEFWSRSGLTALAATLRGENGAMRQGLCLFMQERHPWMLNSHAYGEPGAALGLLSLAVAHPPAFEEVLPQWGWRFLCSWEPGYGLRYSTPHMGAPYMGEESVVNLAYALLGAAEGRGLLMAGGEAERWLE
jgi:hypothetical protein